KVWDAATDKVQQTLKGHSHSVSSVAFSPDGKLIASASHDKTVKVWDAATGKVQQTLKGHSDWVSSVAFSPDGKFLLTDMGSIKLDALNHIDAREARHCGYGLSPNKSWITWNVHKALWLPSEYRPSASAIWCSVPPSTVARVAIGCRSGRLIVIGFSGPPPGLSSS
ncbi:WD40-repeat-containing domain protein, partial [Dactylonectria macrodidyma]